MIFHGRLSLFQSRDTLENSSNCNRPYGNVRSDTFFKQAPYVYC